VQFIDVRDLAVFMIHLAEERILGIFNTLNPPGSVTMGQLLEAPDVELVWVGPALLAELGLQPWSDLPVWLPPVGEHAGYHLCRTDRAQAAGLTIRPLQETCADTLAWWRSLPEDSPLRAVTGLSAGREAEALRAIGGFTLPS
jgi:2'-hydroxyisoflavone reductase